MNNTKASMSNSLSQVRIRIHADHVQKLDNGEWEILIPGIMVLGDESKMLERLFPNTLRDIEHLLRKEALIESVIR